MASRHGLGRGLGALITAAAARTASAEGPYLELPVGAIRPNPNQPRKDFDDMALRELTESLRRSGVLQPIVVRACGQDEYELIVGERRWRAAKAAGLGTIPAVIREANEAESLEIALVENLLREDLNPIEEAEAYQRLLAEFGWTQEQLAERVGKDRSSIANCLRLLKLPEEIQADLRSGRLAMGHARALLSLSSAREQIRLRDEIVKNSWSVRLTEEGVKRKQPGPRRHIGRRPADLIAAEESLRRRLATRVRLVGSETRGRIEISYVSRDELERLLEQLEGRP